MIKNEYDLLKTLAVLLVILGHITIIYKDSYEVLEILTTIIYIYFICPFSSLSAVLFINWDVTIINTHNFSLF